ncbi:hypothetical protein [Nocardiopsis coralliicola]
MQPSSQSLITLIARRQPETHPRVVAASQSAPVPGPSRARRAGQVAGR